MRRCVDVVLMRVEGVVCRRKEVVNIPDFVTFEIFEEILLKHFAGFCIAQLWSIARHRSVETRHFFLLIGQLYGFAIILHGNVVTEIRRGKIDTAMFEFLPIDAIWQFGSFPPFERLSCFFQSLQFGQFFVLFHWLFVGGW